MLIFYSVLKNIINLVMIYSNIFLLFLYLNYFIMAILYSIVKEGTVIKELMLNDIQYPNLNE